MSIKKSALSIVFLVLLFQYTKGMESEWVEQGDQESNYLMRHEDAVKDESTQGAEEMVQCWLPFFPSWGDPKNYDFPNRRYLYWVSKQEFYHSLFPTRAQVEMVEQQNKTSSNLESSDEDEYSGWSSDNDSNDIVIENDYFSFGLTNHLKKFGLHFKYQLVLNDASDDSVFSDDEWGF